MQISFLAFRLAIEECHLKSSGYSAASRATGLCEKKFGWGWREEWKGRPEYGMRLLMVAISDSELRLLLLLGAEFFILCDDTLIG